MQLTMKLIVCFLEIMDIRMYTAPENIYMNTVLVHTLRRRVAYHSIGPEAGHAYEQS